MRVGSLWATVLLCMATAIAVGACHRAGDGEPAEQGDDQTSATTAGVTVGNSEIYLHRDGIATQLQLQEEDLTRLTAAVSALAENASSRLRLAVTPQRMAEFYAQSEALELIYPAPVSLTLAFNAQTIRPTRLFVMLAGELLGAEDDRLVIVHGYPEYSAGPLVVSEGRRELRTLLDELRE